MSASEQGVRERVVKAEALLGGLEALPEPARTRAQEAAAALVALYGEALARVLERLPERHACALCEDELLRHLLIVHGLHPESVEERVRSALAGVQPYLATHGGGVELEAITGATARVRLQGACHGCPSSAATLRLAVEEAIRAVAPEIEHIEASGEHREQPPREGLTLPVIQAPPGPCPAPSVGAPS